MLKHALDGLLALGVGAAGEFAQETLLAVGTEPIGSSHDTLDTNRIADAVGAGARTVRVEILVHLVASGLWSAACLP